MEQPDSATLLDAAAIGREVALLASLVLIRTKGDPEKALEMLASFEGLAPPESINELDVVPIATQAIREARGMIVV